MSEKIIGIALRDPKNRGRDKAILNRYQKEDMVAKTIEWIMQGISDKGQLNELIRQNSPETLSYQNAQKVITMATTTLEEISKQTAAEVIPIHVEKYEKIYRYFYDLDIVNGQNKAMKAKEKLIGLLKDKNTVRINKETNVVINRQVEYDYSKINPEQMKRLQFLTDKAR